MKTYMIEDIKNITMDDVVLQTSNDENFDFLEISWQLTNECNYKCTYCYGQDPITRDSYTKIDKLKFIVDQIFSINKKYYHFSFLGGNIIYQLSKKLEDINVVYTSITTIDSN